MRDRPYDAVLVVSFGGPQGMDDVRPFIGNVLRGRRVPPERVEEVVHHYALFGGKSPLTEITQRQADGLQARLQQRGLDLPVYVGMRNWHPFLADTLSDMSRAGVRRAIGFIAAPHHVYSSCTQYKENVIDARREVVNRGLSDVEITYVDSWYDHPGFINAVAEHVREALDKLDPAAREKARLIFTAHSVPTSMAGACRYTDQLTTSARNVAKKLGHERWALVYQSRSGRPQDPWLEPDICDYLRAEHARGLKAAIISAIGFVCDHVEVLFDLDHEAAEVCHELSLPMVRAETVNDNPIFLDMMADVVESKYEQHRYGGPLMIVSPGVDRLQ